MQAVIGQFLLQQSSRIDHGAEVVEVDATIRGAVIAHPAVELKYLVGRSLNEEKVVFRRVVVDGQNRRKNHSDIVGARQLRQRLVIALDLLQSHGASVAGDVIGAGENDYSRGLKIDYVGAKRDPHLAVGLSVDAAIHIGLAGKVLRDGPDVGDGVAEKNNPLLSGGGRLQRGIGVTIAPEFAEIVGQNGGFRKPVLVQTLGGRRARRRLAECGSTQQQGNSPTETRARHETFSSRFIRCPTASGSAPAAHSWFPEPSPSPRSVAEPSCPQKTRRHSREGNSKPSAGKKLSARRRISNV